MPVSMWCRHKGVFTGAARFSRVHSNGAIRKPHKAGQKIGKEEDTITKLGPPYRLS
jgi:hypothetical protein